MKYPVTRACPLTGDASHRVLGYIPAAVVAANNPTYRSSFAQILNISPDDEFPIVESPAGFVFSRWLPPDDFLRRVYEDVIDHSKTLTRTITYRAGLLDFGCGYGSLLRMLGGGEVVTIGYEPSGARLASASLGGYEIFNDLDQVAAAGPFNLIICTEVLEHVADPRTALRSIKMNAAPGALFGLTVPDCERSYVAKCLAGLARGARLSAVINPWEHLNYFSVTSIRRLLAEEGFTVLNDFGRTRAARDACLRFGNARASAAVGSLRVFKRAVTAALSTELFCQSA